MRNSSPIIAALSALAAAASAHAATHYKIVDPNPKGNYFIATAVNASGQLAGKTDVLSDGSGGTMPNQHTQTGALFDGTVHPLPFKGGNFSIANSINAAGHITGLVNALGQPSGAYLYDGKSVQVIDATRHPGAIGNSINAKDQIAGSFNAQFDFGAGRPDNIHRPFFYDGTMHDLGDLGGHTGEALALNDVGAVVGYSSMPSGYDHAFLYDGKLHDLGVHPGCSTSHANGINNAGKIVGTSNGCADNTFHAFVYDGAMHDLAPGVRAVGADAVNASGDIVGTATIGNGPHAVMWRGAAMIDLNAQVPVNPEHLVFEEAFAIGDGGAIVVKSNNRSRIYLLAPLGEAESAATLQKVDSEAQARKAAFLASVNPLNGSGGKIARAGAGATLTYSDAAGNAHSYAVVRPKFAQQMMANVDTGGWIYVASDHKSGVTFNVTAHGDVDGKPLNPMMIPMMVGQ